MKKIVLINTVKPMYLRFENQLRAALKKEEVKIYNILDSFFSMNPSELGYFSVENFNRLYLTLKSAELINPVCIPVACSTLSPYLDQLQPFISVPLLQIDKSLGTEAIAKGDKIMVLASAPSAEKSTVDLIQKTAERAGRNVSINSVHDLSAFKGMQSGDMETHDSEMLKTAEKIKDADVIVFAQGSMEHLSEKVEKITGIPVITAPRLLVEDVKAVVEGASQPGSE